MRTHPQRLLYGIAIGLIVFIPIWSFKIAPHLLMLPADFHYEANILSQDNFFDEEKQTFLGEQLSKAKFSYEVISSKKGILIIKNIFDVRKLTGEKIFAVERLYGVNPKTGQHVSGYGDQDRTGYLFAPRNLRKQDYTYWHINYNEPALLKFQEEVFINGLKVYRYACDYHADQTQNLTFLPEVSKTRGINLDINLQVWVEPVSGWMVKYEDKTIAYYYDLKTRQRLHPWNSFHNRYTNESIADEIQIARKKRQGIIFTEKVIPIFFGFMVFIFYYIHISLGEKMTRFLVLFLLVIFFSPLSVWAQAKKSFTIGISQWGSSTEYERNIQGFKDGLAEKGYVDGKNVKFIQKNPDTNIDRQIEIIQSFVDQKVDLIYSLATPGTLVAKGVTSKIPIVFSIVTYPVETGMVDSLTASGNNLTGTINYVPAPRQYFYFEKIYPSTRILSFIHRKGEPNSAFQYNEFKEYLDKRKVTLVDIAAIDIEDIRQQLNSNIDKVDALYAACDTLVQTGGAEVINEFSRQFKKPSFSCVKDGVLSGALIGNVKDFFMLGKISGEKAALILEGIPPSKIQVEASSQDEIIINIKTARELGLTVPQDLLNKAKQIIDQ